MTRHSIMEDGSYVISSECSECGQYIRLDDDSVYVEHRGIKEEILTGYNGEEYKHSYTDVYVVCKDCLRRFKVKDILK